ncbi:MAG: AtpZ/AtpI family protein [Lachnospirales bacterium]
MNDKDNDKNKEFNLSKISKKHNKNHLAAFYLITQIGLYVLICIFLCFYAGVLLDNLLNTKYIFKVAFIIIGILSAFIGVYKLAMKEVHLTKSDSDYLNKKDK